jgi:hypothetical protein
MWGSNGEPVGIGGASRKTAELVEHRELVDFLDANCMPSSLDLELERFGDAESASLPDFGDAEGEPPCALSAMFSLLLAFRRSSLENAPLMGQGPEKGQVAAR